MDSKLSFERPGPSVVPSGPFDGKWEAKCWGSDPYAAFISDKLVFYTRSRLTNRIQPLNV